ncbi:DsbA family protein [Haloarcula rubripromontorii]|uniref:Disulfide bond formation protein DsbA n=1 Tax=Haloarcula rubripromontorii TaxID=1705562 RepID=A0A0N0BNZ6_9EURY|nr:thioredoxin domain-containing protein [Haloarcula rubripromontorii]KOX93023.1 disulfide bond formation protein DsbA [Haloarcula rubripromontorii]NLV06632.1 thioredoxin domain-containing protein [Haloarcula rubripromontorii]
MTRFTRRGFLSATTVALGALAGCVGGGSESAGTETPTPAPGQPLSTPVAGDPEADVTVAVYEDYACPHCATYSESVFPEVQDDYLADGTIRYEFHDFPIPVDEEVSWQAASAARAVQDTVGDDAFFTYSKRLFANQTQLGPDTYADLTEGLDVDGEAIRAAATGELYRPTVSGDREAGIDRGVQGTPAVFVNGEQVEWSEIAYEPVRAAIEAARSDE